MTQKVEEKGVNKMFVEFTDSHDFRIAINKNKIIRIWENGDFCGIDTEIDNHGFCIYVKESYEEVLAKLNS